MESELAETVDNKDIDVMVWDLETTGFTAPECKILEIGAFVVRGEEVEQKHWVLKHEGEEVEQKHWVLKHEGVEIPEKITELTGITQAIIDAEGRDPIECLNEFLPLFKRVKKHVTHNGMRFDIPFLIESAAAHFKYTPEQKMAVTNLLRSTAYDTAVEYKAKKLEMTPFFRESYAQFADRVMNTKAYGIRYTLNLCVEELGIVHDGTRHRAIADVALTHEVYKRTQPALI